MSSTEVRGAGAPGGEGVGRADLKLEVVVIPVADVDRAKEFYGNVLAWRPDADFAFPNGFRIVQFTPPGSPCSIQFGTDVTPSAPGSAQFLYLIVSDIEAAREDLAGRGVGVSEAFHGSAFDPARRIGGPDPERQSYRSYATFADPDGNTWLLQEVTTRLPGRVDEKATYVSVDDLAGALRRAEVAHGEHEKRTGERDENWPAWYAAYMVAERTGTQLPV